MRRSLRHPDGRQLILDRLARLTPDHARRWGRMQSDQLLPHLASGLRMALGERHVERSISKKTPSAVFRYLAIYVLPWPKGKIESPPGAFDTPSAGWERDREIVVELIDRFATTLPEKLGTFHPSFGPMRPRDWDVLQYRHCDHHLRQFGV